MTGPRLAAAPGRLYYCLMSREEVLQKLGAHRDELHAMGVRSLSIFGSVARNEAGPQSDVDLLVDFNHPVGYFHLFDVQKRIESLLKCRVDLVTKGGLHPETRERILAEAVRAA